jgi:alpha-methylacyl-CoA racemase
VQPLAGLLVVDLTRHLPGPYASRELLRLGARIVRLESPEGDPLRAIAPQWHAALNAGKESVVCDFKAEPELGHALCARADVVLEGFRPGVAARLGVGPDDVPDRVVYCSLTGFGIESRHAVRAGHDLNYLGWAGALADTAPALPPVQAAALGAGALAAVAEVLAALLDWERTGRGARLVVSMTHGSHRFVSHRVAGDPRTHLLTGGLACYRIYATADGRWLTVGALEAHFFERLCALLARPDLAPLQFADDQDALTDELAAIFATRPLDEWLELFDAEDVAVGPVATLAEAADDLSSGKLPRPVPRLGQHTDEWRTELGF